MSLDFYSTGKFFILLKAISIVESGGDPSAIGDNGKALGHLQIHAGVVQDVNETYKTNFTHEMAFSYDVSCTLFWFWQKRYCRAYQVATGKAPDAEACARMWNGGLQGLIHNENATDDYWNKVKPVYLKLLKENNH